MEQGMSVSEGRERDGFGGGEERRTHLTFGATKLVFAFANEPKK